MFVIDVESKPYGRSTAYILTAVNRKGERWTLRQWLWNAGLAERTAEKVRLAQRSGAWTGPGWDRWQRFNPQSLRKRVYAEHVC